MATRLRMILYGTTLLAGADVAQARSGTPFAAAAQARGGTYRPMPSLKGSQSQHFAAARSMLGARTSLHVPRITPVKPNFGNSPPQLGLSALLWRGGSGGAGNALPGMLSAYPNYPNKPPQLGVPSRWLNGQQMIPVFPNYANKPQFGMAPSMGHNNGTGAGMPRVLPLAPTYAGAPQPMLAPTWTPAATAVPVLPSLGHRPGLSAPDLGLTPAELKIMALRDKLDLESPDDVQGPGQLPNGLGESSAGRGSDEPPAPQAARDPGCVGSANPLPNPHDRAATGRTVPSREITRWDEHLADAGGFPFVLDRRSFRREGPGDYLGRSENGELVNIEFDRHQATVTTTWTTTNPTVTHTRTDRYHRHPDGSLTDRQHDNGP